MSEQWMSYAELGDRLGISADGARTKAKRAGWAVQPGNDGRARVLVPTAELPEHAPEQPERLGGLLAELRRVHAERITELTARAEKAEQEAERDRALLGQTREALARAEEQARLAAERVALREDRIAELREEVARLRRPWWRQWIG